MSEIKKQELTSLNIKEEQLKNLKQIFPEAFTEGLNIDWEKLKLTLGENVDVGKERYGMNWPGKADCFKTIQQPSIATLVPDRAESIDFDSTENLFIEGDNLEVLKLLQKSYLGKIKMIYIDPPYNTGKDFVYPDDYSESLDTYLRYTGQVDNEGKKFQANSDSDGRYHSTWLNMIYPRLFLAKNLLSNDGVIFISIDNHEFDNLKKVCDEIFGPENFISCIANVNNPKGRSDDKYIATSHEYVFVYKKQEIDFAGWKPDEKVIKRFNKIDLEGATYREIDLRKTGDADRRIDRPTMFYYFYFDPISVKLFPSKERLDNKDLLEIIPLRADGTEGRWRWELQTALKRIENLIVREMPQRGILGVFEKDFLAEKSFVKPTSSWLDKVFNSERGSEQFIDLGFKKEVFPKPKPVGLIKKILEFTIKHTDKDSIILDFFAGSASTSQAVIEYNMETDSNVKFICIQLPEKTEEKDDAFKEGFTSISQISKERIRRVLKRHADSIENDNSLFKKDVSILDLGFKVFKLQPSNFKIWDSTLEKKPEVIQAKLFEHIDHIPHEEQQEAILYELLLKSGFELTTPIETIEVAGKNVFSIADGLLLICLEKNMTLECLKAMAEMEPTRVICLDEAFEGENADALKTNAVQIMKSKGVLNFRTV